MALEAVVYQQDILNYNGKELFNMLGGNWGYDQFGLEKLEEEDHHHYYHHQQHFLDNQTDQNSLLLHGDHHQHWNHHDLSSPPPPPPLPNSMVPTAHNFNEPLNKLSDQLPLPSTTTAAAATTTITRPKRRRSKSRKNKEEIENQRMTHIAVERNRRKQMNDYLSVLRSLMPESYVQRGDQASIIGGAINFVKELEHRLQLLGSHKEKKEKSENGLESSPPFDEFFTFPQYSTTSSSTSSSSSTTTTTSSSTSAATGCENSTAAAMTTESSTTSSSTDHHQSLMQSQSAIADIEVTMVESHANLKIRSHRRSKQLLKLVSGLHNMRFTILHLNVTTVDETVLYSFSVKVEEDCSLTSVDEIATAVNQLLGRIQEDAMLN